jgi:N-alpha-acetyltransferase 40
MASERELAGAQHKAIEKANQQKNPFTIIAEDYGIYEKNEISLKLKYFSSKEMSRELQKFCFKLAERNVGEYYRSCHLGWQPKVKQNDMAKSWAKYLIAYDDTKPVGFTQFRFDMDYGRSCVYW